jgi:hypothetical protein
VNIVVWGVEKEFLDEQGIPTASELNEKWFESHQLSVWSVLVGYPCGIAMVGLDSETRLLTNFVSFLSMITTAVAFALILEQSSIVNVVILTIICATVFLLVAAISSILWLHKYNLY